MASLQLIMCIALFALVSSRRLPWDDQFGRFSTPEDFPYQQFPPPSVDNSFRRHRHDDFSFKPYTPVLPKNDPSWSEVDIIKLHYDCSGRLIREEVVKLKTLTGVQTFPEADLFKMPLSKHPEIAISGNGNSLNDYYESGTSRSVIVPEAAVTPLNFRSIKERFKSPKTTQRPVSVEETTPAPEIVFLPDRIIDVPKIPCPDGQNEDPLGNCRPVYDESLFQ